MQTCRRVVSDQSTVDLATTLIGPRRALGSNWSPSLSMADSSVMDSSVSAADQSSDLFENEFCTADDSSIEGCSQYLHQVGESVLFWLGGSGHTLFLPLTEGIWQ